MKCPRCGSPNAPYGEVRERSIDLVIVDLRCLDCGFCWSDVMSCSAYEKDVASRISFFGVCNDKNSRR